MIPPALPDPVAPLQTLRVQAGRAEALAERAAAETPFELRLNGRSHTLLMVSPAQIEELALGLCLSEGVVGRADEVLGVSLGRGELPGLGAALWADVSLAPETARRAKVKRVAPAATSCGLCGLESFADLGGDVPGLAGLGPAVETRRLFDLLEAMEKGQTIFAQTGCTHAVGLGTPAGGLLVMAEDVGRHNALDKAIGLALKAGLDLHGCLALLSGRISYEMALKAARAGLTLLASVSAPTALGVGIMRRLGVTGVGFLRDGRLTVYSHPHRLLLDGRPLAAPEATETSPA